MKKKKRNQDVNAKKNRQCMRPRRQPGSFYSPSFPRLTDSPGSPGGKVAPGRRAAGSLVCPPARPSAPCSLHILRVFSAIGSNTEASRKPLARKVVCCVYVCVYWEALIGGRRSPVEEEPGKRGGGSSREQHQGRSLLLCCWASCYKQCK